MNLFWLDSDVTWCAQAHQDAHVGKMLLEAVQLLCTTFLKPAVYLRFAADSTEDELSEVVSDTRLLNRDPLTQEFIASWAICMPSPRLAADLLPYSHTHVNHPCALWVRASRANFDRAIELAEALAAEFRYRFDKPHGSEAALDWVKRHRSEAQVSDGPLTPYALAMPEAYVKDAQHSIRFQEWQAVCIAAYRAYYRAEKRGHWRKSRDPAKPSTWIPAKWTRRDPPEWF